MIRILLIVIGCCLLGITPLHAQDPVADFSANVTAGCGPLGVHFTDKSTNKPLSWTWDLGNGQFSTDQNPNAVYSTPGTYTVTLIVKNSFNSSSMVKTDYITVYPYPTARFTSPQLACAPSTVQFTDYSTPGQGSIVKWAWILGNGQTSTDPNPSASYTQPGYYNISLTVTNSGGCSNTITLSRYLRIVQGVQPDFSWNQTSSSCSAPFDITFVNQSAGPGTLSYQWSLGNTNSSTATNPSTTYPANTAYPITLTATSSYGCQASVTKNVTFQGGPPTIAGPDNACLNSPVTFQNASSPTPVSSSWDFGDGTTSTQTNPEKTYTSTGTFTVTLTSTNNSCTSTTSKQVNVTTSLPASFTSDKTGGCKTPTQVTFTDQTSGSTSWHWDFGDGETSTEQQPKHTYNTPGTYDVKLNVVTGSGCASSLTKVQAVTISTPTVDVKANTMEGCISPGGGISPVYVINAPDGVASYQWTAPGATPSSSTATFPHFDYTTENNYDLTLQITTKDGCTASKSFPGAVHIGNKIVPDFTASVTDVCARTPITFTSLTSNSQVDKWSWLFGDGTGSPLASPVSHSYADTGFQNVSLIITHHGCAQTTTKTKYVYIDPPLAGFQYKIDCINRTHVEFFDTTKYDPTKAPPTYLWDFGDGSPTSTAVNPVHDYTLPLKSWNVTLTVTQGCIDHVTTAVNLQPVVASFTVSPTAQCKSTPFTLNSTSTPASGIASYKWTVNGVTRSTTTPSFTTDIPTTGPHTVQLVAIDGGGCPFPAVPDQQVEITGPAAKLAPSGGCKNSPITINDLSTPYKTDAINSWHVTFGDGKDSIFTSLPITHTYTDTSNYDILIDVKDVKGCVDTLRIPSTARITSTTAAFYAPDTVFCPGAPAPFIDTSTGRGLTYSWDFGDGSPASTDADPKHTYPTTNDVYYTVSLKVTDGAGCTNIATFNNYMHIVTPVASFDMDDSTGICIPMRVSFIPTGKYYDSLYWDFGDGTPTSNLDTTDHFYNSFGTAPDYKIAASLTMQGAGGCQDRTSRNVYVYDPRNRTHMSFSPNLKCDSITSFFTLDPPPYTSFWLYFGDGVIDSSGSLTAEHTYRGLGSYVPQIALSDGNGCLYPFNSGSITVQGAVPVYSKDKNAFCDNGSVFFHGVIVTNDGQSSLTWDFGDGTTLTGMPTGTPSDPFLSQQHAYTNPGINLATLSIVTNSGCKESYTDTIHVWQTPHPAITTEGALCAGLIQFHGNTTVPNVDSVSYAWTFDQGEGAATSKDPSILLAPGSVTATLKTSVQFGCNDNTAQTILVHPLPEIKGPKEITTPVGIPVTMPFAYSPNVDTWSWSPSTYLDCTDCPNPVSTPTFNTTYLVSVKDVNNCVSQDTITVKTLCGGDNYFVPNTFSPNNDGVNDVFYPRGKGLHDIQSMRIFNRWGQLIFERKNFPANSAPMGWDGTINGRPAPSDAYVYIIEVICINAQVIALKGDVTLIR